MRVRYVGPSPARRMDRDLCGLEGTFKRDEWREVPDDQIPKDVVAFFVKAWDWELEPGTKAKAPTKGGK